jgi:hypothetical protein
VDLLSSFFFFRFFDEVWLHTEIIEPQLVLLQANPFLWNAFHLFHKQMQVCQRTKSSLTIDLFSPNSIIFIFRAHKFPSQAFIEFLRQFESKNRKSKHRRTDSAENHTETIQSTSFYITHSNITKWRRYLCDHVIPMIEHFFAKHFRREAAQMAQLDAAAELFDDMCGILLQLTHPRHTKNILSCLSVCS